MLDVHARIEKAKKIEATYKPYLLNEVRKADRYRPLPPYLETWAQRLLTISLYIIDQREQLLKQNS